MKRALLLLVLGILSLVVAMPAGAQGETPYVIRSTRPISTELREALDAWLAISPPSEAPYYIVTYAKLSGDDWMVSLVGVDLETPESEWELEDGALWLGSVRVNPAWEVEPLNPTGAGKGGGMMRARLAAGGGTYVAFPHYNSALYGPRGVHGSGDYGTSGMLFIDLVGGDDMGVASMPPQVIASDAGEVDYVCDDGTSVAVRTYNSTTGDYFLYAHMLDNANLVLEHEFQRGQYMGNLKYGSFDDECGWAEQHTNHYHVHWGFVPASGRFQVGSCILTVSSQTWTCGEEIVRVGEFLVGGGGYSGSGESDGTSGGGATVVTDPTFWDYVLGGIVALINLLFVQVLPEHGSFEFIYVFFNTIEMLFRLARILVFQSINIYPIIYALGIVIAFKLIFSLVYVALILVRAWKQLVPVAGA